MAYDIFKSALGEDHPNTKIVKDNLDFIQQKTD